MSRYGERQVVRVDGGIRDATYDGGNVDLCCIGFIRAAGTKVPSYMMPQSGMPPNDYVIKPDVRGIHEILRNATRRYLQSRDGIEQYHC